MEFKRSLEAVLARPGNDAEQAFAHGYKVVSKGLRESVRYNNPRHVNNKHYRSGKQAACNAKGKKDK